MRVIVTKLESFSSKDGKSYVKASAISSTGLGVEIFTTKEKYDVFGFDASKKVLSPIELKELFEKFETAEVSFDQKGRLESFS